MCLYLENVYVTVHKCLTYELDDGTEELYVDISFHCDDPEREAGNSFEFVNIFNAQDVDLNRIKKQCQDLHEKTARFLVLSNIGNSAKFEIGHYVI